MNTDYRYNNDLAFRQVVDHMIGLIASLQFTPSEMREAAVLASIMYAERSVNWHSFAFDPEIEHALKVLSAKRKEVMTAHRYFGEALRKESVTDADS